MKRPAEPWTALAQAVSNGCAPGMEILRERGRDVRIARVAGPGGRSVIVKCWRRTGLRGALRRLSRTNVAWREFTALARIEAAGIPCPAALAYRRLSLAEACHTEAIISGDLGVCRDSTEWFKMLLRRDPPAATAFEDHLIEITRAMVARGLLDTDHRLPNFVVPPDGHPVRLDFELCVPTRVPHRHPRRLGRMLGTLLGSHVFAVQPDTARSADFARRLLRQIPVSRRARRTVCQTVADMLEYQRRHIQLDVSFTLPEDI